MKRSISFHHQDTNELSPAHHWLRRIVVVGGAALLALNVVSFIQARAALRFGRRGYPPEELATLPRMELIKAALRGPQLRRPQNNATPADHHLTYDIHSIPVRKQQYLEVWHVSHPEPRGIVVAFPGYAGTKDSFLQTAEHVHKLGYSSILVDFRGAGGSTGSTTTLGMREAEDVALVAAYVRTHWGTLPMILLGCSMGSAAILRATATHGVHADALILEGTFDRLLTTTRHRFSSVGAPRSPGAELVLLWGSLLTRYNGFRHDPATYASSVSSPTLLIQGWDDPWIRPEETQAVAQALRGPVEVVYLPVAHVMPYVNYAPRQWLAMVEPFLTSLGKPQEPQMPLGD